MTVVFASAQSSLVKDSENNAYYIRQGLVENQVDLRPFTPTKCTLAELMRLGPLKLALRCRRLDYHLSVHPDVLRRQGEDIANFAAQERASLIIANAPYVVSRLPPTIPMVLYMDAPTAAFVDMGHYYHRWDRTSLKRLIEWDRRAIERAEVVVYHSKWAMDEALKHYEFPASKYTYIRPGANLPYIDRSKARVTRSSSESVNFLFFGRYWDRKGGPQALRIVEALRKKGMNARLFVAGPLGRPAEIAGLAWVDFIGRLSKDDAGDLARIDEVFKTTDFLLAPTLADSSTAALREAAGYGAPSVATLIGAHSELLRTGEEGLLMSKESSADDWASSILHVWTDQPRYLAMRCNSRKAYESRMTWRGSMADLKALLQTRDLM